MEKHSIKPEIWFVEPGSIVRTIWGSSDTVLLVFAGSAAEFALNKSVDWLYYTGKLPADPIGRLFSTVKYAQAIVFWPREEALAAIDQINKIHGGVERQRGRKIPDSAYLDVLFMLIDYTIRSYELLERRLTAREKADIYAVFLRLGTSMHLKGLPPDFSAWEQMRATYLERNLENGDLTKDLYHRYRIALGGLRYKILLGGQALLVPPRVKELLGLPSGRWMRPMVTLYKLARLLRLDRAVKTLLLPKPYRNQLPALDAAPKTGRSSRSLSTPAKRYRTPNGTAP
ncbi:MAG TPA: oxygenase MpaB family protein [Puia sp.]|nr:oxygenase MpaB family protein [Puia sp.]